MTKEERSKLKKLLIYMDIRLAQEETRGLNAQWLTAVWSIQDEFPEFANPNLRQGYIRSVIAQLNEEETK